MCPRGSACTLALMVARGLVCRYYSRARYCPVTKIRVKSVGIQLYKWSCMKATEALFSDVCMHREGGVDCVAVTRFRRHLCVKLKRCLQKQRRPAACSLSSLIPSLCEHSRFETSVIAWRRRQQSWRLRI